MNHSTRNLYIALMMLVTASFCEICFSSLHIKSFYAVLNIYSWLMIFVLWHVCGLFRWNSQSISKAATILPAYSKKIDVLEILLALGLLAAILAVSSLTLGRYSANLYRIITSVSCLTVLAWAISLLWKIVENKKKTTQQMSAGNLGQSQKKTLKIIDAGIRPLVLTGIFFSILIPYLTVNDPYIPVAYMTIFFIYLLPIIFIFSLLYQSSLNYRWRNPVLRKLFHQSKEKRETVKKILLITAVDILVLLKIAAPPINRLILLNVVIIAAVIVNILLLYKGYHNRVPTS